jgi:O-antigen chain-terminating methyltransferase
MKLNVENVMARVREEVIRRGGTFDPDDDGQGIEGRLPFWKSTIPALKVKSAYSLPELLRYSDREFVETAYRAILRRAPDPNGMDVHLTKLRSGEMTKVEVLAALRWSPEGMRRSVHVDGLLLPTIVQKWKRRRWLGPMVRWMTGVLHISNFVDRAKQIEAGQAAEIQELGRLVNSLSREVDDKFVILEEQGYHLSEEERLLALETGLQLDSLRARVATLEEQVAGELMPLRAQVARHEEAIARLEGRTDHGLDPLYVAFEEAFRGSRELILMRAEPYIDIVRSSGAGTPDAPVIDLGCGRGDWLDLLRENGMTARGVDTNRMFLGMCAERGLDVVEGDVITVLKSMPDASAGAITAMHLVEHLPFDLLIQLLDECRRVLRPGGVLALETPNPENPWVGSHLFYMDPTHRNPLPPLALHWFVAARGFADARIERWTVGRDMGPPALLSDDIPGASSLNVLLGQTHIGPDYSVIARRA